MKIASALLLAVGLFAVGCSTQSSSRADAPTDTAVSAPCESCAECLADAGSCDEGENCPACSAMKDTATAAPEGEGDDGPVAVIEAQGMSCPLCASNADRRLMKLPGVRWTNIDLGTGQVSVGLDPNQTAPDPEQLKTAIRDAGFTATDVKMPAEDTVQP